MCVLRCVQHVLLLPLHGGSSVESKSVYRVKADCDVMPQAYERVYAASGQRIDGLRLSDTGEIPWGKCAWAVPMGFYIVEKYEAGCTYLKLVDSDVKATIQEDLRLPQWEFKKNWSLSEAHC